MNNNTNSYPDPEEETQQVTVRMTKRMIDKIDHIADESDQKTRSSIIRDALTRSLSESCDGRSVSGQAIPHSVAEVDENSAATLEFKLLDIVFEWQAEALDAPNGAYDAGYGEAMLKCAEELEEFVEETDL